MDELMQLLYNDITGRTMGKYYPQTDYAERREEQDRIGRELWEQLPPEQRELLEDPWPFPTLPKTPAATLQTGFRCK